MALKAVPKSDEVIVTITDKDGGVKSWPFSGENVLTPYCAKAKAFAKLAKTKTLNGYQVKTIQKLGFKVLYTNGGVYSQQELVGGATIYMWMGNKHKG